MEALKSTDWLRPPVRVTIADDIRPLYVYPAVLAAASPVWAARVNGSWADDDRPIDWSSFNAETVHCVMSFLHTGDYKIAAVSDDGYKQEPGEEQPKPNRPLVHAKVYIFASQFLCDKLKDLAVEYLESALKEQKSPITFAENRKTMNYIYDNTIGYGDGDEAREVIVRWLVDELDADSVNSLRSQVHGELIDDFLMKMIRLTRKREEEKKALEREVAQLKTATCEVYRGNMFNSPASRPPPSRLGSAIGLYLSDRRGVRHLMPGSEPGLR